MARPSNVAQRSLTLTEELEKLEQSITLTLQEIDHNFSRAHRIVTSSILPVVEQYAEHSRDVWEGSKFWKQFFEASANVSLNGYEEVPDDDEDFTHQEEDHTITTNDGSEVREEDLLSQSTPANSSRAGTSTSSFMETPGPHGQPYEHSDGKGVTPSSQTPRAKPGRTKESGFATQNSPSKGKSRARESDRSPSPTPSGTLPPETPRAQTLLEDSTITVSTPELPSFVTQSARRTPGSAGRQQQTDTMLHRGVLDKNYRIQATPMGRSGRNALMSASQQTARRDPTTPATAKTNAYDIELDLDSSPMEEAPQMRASLFHTSPGAKGNRRTSGAHKADLEAQRARDRVPGVSVLEPSKSGRSGPRMSLGKAARQSIGAAGVAAGTTLGYGASTGGGGGWDDSDEDDDFGGMSPPKTMAFNVPTSKLMRTPAREASKMIVEDLLATAGAGHMSDEMDSPSVIGKQINFEEDTF